MLIVEVSRVSGGAHHPKTLNRELTGLGQSGRGRTITGLVTGNCSRDFVIRNEVAAHYTAASDQDSAG